MLDVEFVFFLRQTVVFHIIASCVTHLYVRKKRQQGKKATGNEYYAIVQSCSESKRVRRKKSLIVIQ